jgi:hypothetical protein
VCLKRLIVKPRKLRWPRPPRGCRAIEKKKLDLCRHTPYPPIYKSGTIFRPLHKNCAVCKKVLFVTLGSSGVRVAMHVLPMSSRAWLNLTMHISPLTYSQVTSFLILCSQLFYLRHFTLRILSFLCLLLAMYWLRFPVGSACSKSTHGCHKLLFKPPFSNAQRIVFLRSHFSLIYLTTLFHFEL